MIALLRRCVAALALCLAVLFAPLPVAAHPALASAVLLDFNGRSLQGELQLPLDQLGLAIRVSPDLLLAELGPRLAPYLAQHVTVTTPDGLPFALDVLSTSIEPIDGKDAVAVRVNFRPPEGASTQAFTLKCDAILHRVTTHEIFVSARRDFGNAIFADHPQLLGVLRYQRESLTVDRAAGAWWRGAWSVFQFGFWHVAEGTDHLLFLWVLLLPVPLIARNGRWHERGTGTGSIVPAVKIATAFALGHSLTLIVGALGLIRLPSQPVEVAIAASILVSALHALRPMFAGREPLIAASFGLVHGLAFATVIADLGLGGWDMVLSILCFNLGIEAMQLVVLLVTVPLLMLVASRSRRYAAIRIGGALIGAAAACGWLAERALDWRGDDRAVATQITRGLLDSETSPVKLHHFRGTEVGTARGKAPGFLHPAVVRHHDGG